MKISIAGLLLLTTIIINSESQNNTKENITCEQSFQLIEKHRNDTNFIILDLRTEEK